MKDKVDGPWTPPGRTSTASRATRSCTSTSRTPTRRRGASTTSCSATAAPRRSRRSVATDKDIQAELRKAVEELRKAGERAQGKESHTKRNVTLLLAGITLGVLFNPATGPETRKWLKDKVLGPEQPFE